MIPQHTVSSYEQEFKKLNNNLVLLANTVTLAYTRTIQALMNHDVGLAEELILEDRLIDNIQTETEQLCYSMLALRQPVAIDLRTIVHAISISNLLEQIGDHTCNICKRTKRMKKHPPTSLSPCMQELASVGLEGLRKLEHLMAHQTSENAVELNSYDDVIDEHYTALYQDVLKRFSDGKKSAPDAMHVLFAAKNIEKIGDNCADIARQVYSVETGAKLRSLDISY